MRNPNEHDEYSSIIVTIFFVVSIFMMIPIGLFVNAATITFLILGICLFIASIWWGIWGMVEQEICFDWLFEKEDEVKG